MKNNVGIENSNKTNIDNEDSVMEVIVNLNSV